MLHKEFMGGKLVIDIWRDRDEYLGEIHYRTASGIRDYYFNIPQDIDNIAWGPTKSSWHWSCKNYIWRDNWPL